MGKVAALAVFCLVSAVVAPAARVYADNTFILYPEADAWVSQANLQGNYGNSTYLSVKDSSQLAEAYLKFSSADLAALGNEQVVGASLYLYQYQSRYTPGDLINLHKVVADWGEGALTWENKPEYETGVISALTLTEGNEQWRQWSGMGNLVDTWKQGSNFGLVLENGLDKSYEELFSRFYSAEYADLGKRPYLEVVTRAGMTPEPVSSVLFLLGALTYSLRGYRRRA